MTRDALAAMVTDLSNVDLAEVERLVAAELVARSGHSIAIVQLHGSKFGACDHKGAVLRYCEDCVEGEITAALDDASDAVRAVR